MRTLFVLLLAGLAVAPTATRACSCMLGSANASFDQVTHVFVARITALEDASAEPRWRTRNQPAAANRQVGVNYGLRMRFEVEATIKGAPETLSQLVTGYGDGDCGVPALPGTALLVATDDGGEVHYCRLSREVRAPGCKDIEWLDRMRRRVRDGVTDVNYNPFAFKDAEPGRLRQWMESGRNPFTMTLEDCPVAPLSEAERR